jgi:hypothetical protein
MRQAKRCGKARVVSTGAGTVVVAAMLLAGSLSVSFLGGCVVVKPYQREQLAERCMAPGFGDASELKFRSHWEGSRQGSEGGYGTAGGGCGCN